MFDVTSKPRRTPSGPLNLSLSESRLYMPLATMTQLPLDNSNDGNAAKFVLLNKSEKLSLTFVSSGPTAVDPESEIPQTPRRVVRRNAYGSYRPTGGSASVDTALVVGAFCASSARVA